MILRADWCLMTYLMNEVFPMVLLGVQIPTERAHELETAAAASAEASPTDGLVLSPSTAAAARNPATLASQVPRLRRRNISIRLPIPPR